MKEKEIKNRAFFAGQGHNNTKDAPEVESIPLIAYRSYLKCPKCGNGNMTYDQRGVIDLAVYPPVYFHRCDKCDYYSTYTQIYPFIKFAIAISLLVIFAP